MNPDWCLCRTTPGYVSLNDEHNTHVCIRCWKPTWLVYLDSERLCEECGGSFYSKWEANCRSCNFELLRLAEEVAEGGDLESANELFWRVSEPWKGWSEYRYYAVSLLHPPGNERGATQPPGLPAHVPPKPRKGPPWDDRAAPPSPK